MKQEQDILKIIGSHYYETHSKLCEELVKAGYDLNEYYDGGRKWGDFKKVLLRVALIRGVQSYDEYVKLFDILKTDEDELASKQLFARMSGIYTPHTNNTQTDRTRNYRHRQADELVALREATALKWIDENTEQAKEYIAKVTSVKQ